MIKEKIINRKINVFYISNEFLVKTDLSTVNHLNKKEKNKDTELYIARRHHFHLMSKYFNLHNGYLHHELINKLNNCLIYLIPSSRNEDLAEINKEIISKYKGKVPIIIRHYDPYIPKKFDINLLENHSDLVLTYAKNIVNNKNIIFSPMVYDTHLYHIFSYPPQRKRFACMIANNRVRPGYQRNQKNFQQYGIDAQTEREARRELARYIDIDIYGREGWSPLLPNYYGRIHPFDQKYIILSKYKFNLIVDTVILDDYISEKILDSFLVPTVPVYLGTQNISKYIPSNCYISISDFNSYRDLMVFLLNMNQQEYLKYYNNIIHQREKIFQQFSTRINVANQIYKWYNYVYNTGLGLSNSELNKIDNSIRGLNVKISNSYISNFQRRFNLTKMRLRKKIIEYFAN